MMNVTAAPFGELTFLPQAPVGGAYPNIPYSQPYTAHGPFGSFFSQYIRANRYSYWYTTLRPLADLTIHFQKDQPWFGFRLLLKQHIRLFTRYSGEMYLKQGQFSFSYLPDPDNNFALKSGNEYIVFDMCLQPGFLRGLNLNFKIVHELLLAEDRGIASNLGGPAWSNIFVLDAIERLLKYPMSDATAEHLLREVIKAASSNVNIIELTEERIESLFRVRDSIRSNIRAHYHIPDLAQSASMNEQYFKIGFRQVFGMTPFKYLEYERLKAAKRLLRESNSTLQAIAELTGFKEASSFIRMFMKAEGISPHDWRQRVRTNGFL